MGFAAFLCPNHSRVLEDFRYGMNYDLNRHNNGKGGTVYEQHKILSGRKRLKGIPVLSAGTEQPVDKEKLLKYKEWLIANYAVNSVNSMLVRTARQYGKEQIAMIMETMCATGITVWSSCRKYSGNTMCWESQSVSDPARYPPLIFIRVRRIGITVSINGNKIFLLLFIFFITGTP